MSNTAESQAMFNDGLRFDSPFGSRMALVTPGMAETRLSTVSSQRATSSPFCRLIARHPGFDRGQHAERLLAPNLVAAASTIVRRAGLPRREQQVLAPEHQPRALRSA